MNLMVEEPISSPDELRTRREILEIFWRKGVGGNELLRQNTELVDSHLQQNFDLGPGTGEQMCLVALGGYGRKELFPFSDIDILLLHGQIHEKELNSAAEAIFYPLWDAGLDVGHSVRTVPDCLADATGDFFFQVALLDARYLAGSKELFLQLQEAYREKFINGRRQEFLQEMIFHRAERHRRFGKYIYQLEPQIKESRGGLRDIQALIWTARFVFGLQDLAAIKDAGLLTDSEFESFSEASDYLARIRNRLHYISKRKNDRLYFEHQEEIAKAFNYKTGKELLDVECFMRDVYAHMQTIAISADLFFEHADEVINRGALPEESEEKFGSKIDSALAIRNGRIHFSDFKALQCRPVLCIKIFLQAAVSGLPVHYSARKLISANLKYIDADFRDSKEIARYFLKIIQHHNSLAVLEIMLESGFLAAYIPEFARQKSLAQHDIYHVFTVDHHQVQTVAALQDILLEKKDIFLGVANPSLLFLAALVHDIGKGTGKVHAEVGAEMAFCIGKRMGMSSKECSILHFLVLHHLFLTDTAMHRDLEDGELIKSCAEVVVDPDKLSMLYLLSIADAKATGPTVWSKWKDALLLDLYLRIGLQLEKSGSKADDLQQGIEWICGKVKEIVGEKAAVNIATLPDDYLLSFTPEEIAEHILSRGSITTEDTVLVTPKVKEDHCSLLIMGHDSFGLLAKICGVIALHNLKVLSAKIFTWPDGTVVDMLEVRLPEHEIPGELDWQVLKSDLGLAMNFRLGLEHRLNQKMLSGNRRKSKIHSYQSAKVVVDNKSSSQYTIIEVHSQDRLGLLYVITRTLSYFHINIYRAKIDSRSGQVVDVFYVLDHKMKKLTNTSFIEEVRQSLLFAASN